MSSDAVERPLNPGVFARLAQALATPSPALRRTRWFGPQQPLAPQAPPEVKGRQFDYSFGANLNYVPRSEGGITFAELRALADALPLLRAVIETRKDQIAAQNFTVRQRAGAPSPDASARVDAALAFLARPDRRRSFGDWLRMLIEDLLVIDAATIYPRYDPRGKALFARHRRRRDHQAPDRTGRSRARTARPRLSAGACMGCRRPTSPPRSSSTCRETSAPTGSTA